MPLDPGGAVRSCRGFVEPASVQPRRGGIGLTARIVACFVFMCIGGRGSAFMVPSSPLCQAGRSTAAGGQQGGLGARQAQLLGRQIGMGALVGLSLSGCGQPGREMAQILSHASHPLLFRRSLAYAPNP